MNRRAFGRSLTCLLSCARVALCAFLIAGLGEANGQPPSRKARVGVLFNAIPMSELQESSLTSRPALAMRDEIVKAGWRPGNNVEILWRSAESRFEKFPGLIDELVQRRVDVIVVGHNELAALVRKKAPTVPVVMNSGFDLVNSGLVERLSRPGGNITGVELVPSIELFMKRLEMFRELVPGLKRVAFVCCIGRARENEWGTVRNAPGNRSPAWENSANRDIAVLTYEIESADEIEAAMAHAAGMKVQAVLVESCAACYLLSVQRRFHAAAEKHRLPTMHEWLNAVESGALMGYGSEPDANFRRAGYYVGRILNGEKAADLPVERMDDLKLHLNSKAAQAIGLRVPPSLQLRADKVFE